MSTGTQLFKQTHKQRKKAEEKELRCFKQMAFFKKSLPKDFKKIDQSEFREYNWFNVTNVELKVFIPRQGSD